MVSDYKSNDNSTTVLLFLTVFAISLSFALYTNHAWEDWYITYRASKNLALGNGLVFTVGQRVHSFTSPLNTLIPAILSIATGNRSDELVLWLFRIINCCLLGVSVVMLFRVAKALGVVSFPATIMVGLFAVDAKIIDFSINGMETAYMMFFLIATIHVLSVPQKHFVTKLGLSWSGLLWTRPDSFVYFGALALGYLLFKPSIPNVRSRVDMLRTFSLAAGVATVTYLPWTLWTWYYYGTPVPHTIVAKGLFSKRADMGLISDFIMFPYKTIFDSTSIINTFMPPNFFFGGWPDWLYYICGVLGLISAYYWLLPFALPSARAVSFACFIAHFYLSTIAPTVFAWYLPNVTVMAIIVLGQSAQQVSEGVASLKKRLNGRLFLPAKVIFYTCGGSVLVISVLMTLATGYQMKQQQEIIETGNRKQIGLWLKENASPNDRVFIECLGYVGFYSQLKMLDFPGLSSPEVVEMRRQLKSDSFALLINSLQPEWLVLRPLEISEINGQLPLLLSTRYQQVKTFDVTEKIYAHSFPGRGYLEWDKTFIVFKKNDLLSSSELRDTIRE